MRYEQPDPTMTDIITEQSGGRCMDTFTSPAGERCDLPVFAEGKCRVHYSYGRRRFRDWEEIARLLAEERQRITE